MRSKRVNPALTLLAVVLAVATVDGQRRFGGGGRYVAPTVATAESFDGSWHFCRLAYRGRAWLTDYPDADYNFSTRVSELTKTSVGKALDGEPLPLIVRPTDDALFQCPFVMLWQAESLYFTEEDAARMRLYLLKGGFLWSDDSWGTFAWQNFEHEMAKVLPEPQYRFVDLPASHPMFNTRFTLKKVPQIPGISYWWRSGGDTSEQGADSAQVHVRGVADAHGRLMVLSTHNTDIADGWEREGVGSALLPDVLGRRLRRGYQRAALRHDALSARVIVASFSTSVFASPSRNSTVVARAFQPASCSGSNS